MRLFIVLIAIVVSFCGILTAEDFDFSLLSKPQTQSEHLKVQSPSIPTSQLPEQWEQPALEIASEKPIGALLLKTGYLYLGEAVLDKNVYHVIGAKGKPKIPAYKVEYAGTDRYEIYRYKRNKPETASYDGIYSLAKWCRDNGMYDEAISEFQNCKSYAAYPQLIKSLDKEISGVEDLKRNAQKRASAENTVVEMITNRVPDGTPEDSFDLKSWRLAVDSEVLEKFKKDVEPQLLRRCGAADCHGSNSEQEFRLTQPLKKYSTSEATHRNLKATFDQINFQQPAASPLLTYPQKDHGGAKAIYTRQTKSQLTPIFQWIQLVPNAMPDFVEKYLAQKREAEQAEYFSTVQAGYSKDVSRTISTPPPNLLEYGPIEQVAHEQVTYTPRTSVSPGFSFFGQNRPMEQRVELVPNSNSFHSQPKRPTVSTIENANKPSPMKIPVPQPTSIPANADPRQYRMPTQIQSQDPFDPNLFNQKYYKE